MQNRFFLVVTLVFGCVLSDAQVTLDEIVFDKTDYDFGAIKEEDGIKSISYSFTNTSANPYMITGLEAACGCTNLRSDKNTYEPGERGKITVDFNPDDIRGEIRKWVYIRGNYSDGFQKDLSFRAEVTSMSERVAGAYYKGEFGYLMMDVNHFPWGQHYKNQVITDTVKFFNDGYGDIVISSAESSLPFVTVENLPITLPVDSSTYIVVKADLTNVDTIANFRANLSLNTNDRFFPVKDFPIFLELIQDFSGLSKRQIKKAARLTLSSTEIQMGEMRRGAKRTKNITLTNTGKRDLIIRQIDSHCSCTVVTPDKRILKPGEQISLSVTFDAINKKGPQGKVVTIITNDPVNSVQTIIVRALVD